MEEVTKTTTESLQGILDALLLKGSIRDLRKDLQIVAEQHALLVWALEVRKTFSKRDLKKFTRLDPERIRLECEAQPRMTVAELEAIGQTSLGLRAVLGGAPVEIDKKNLELVWRSLTRPRQGWKPKVLKAEFVQAFCIRMKARRQGKVVTAESLAQLLMPYQYRQNPESAIRSMQRGLRRVEEEHKRCEREGVPSPVPPDERQNNE